MCGILGAVDLDGAFDRKSHDQFVGLTDLVRYRGPDDAHYLTLNLRQRGVTSPNSFDVFLGSRRLSILDLSSAGHQPMTDAKGRWIVFNGEIAKVYSGLDKKSGVIQTADRSADRNAR